VAEHSGALGGRRSFTRKQPSLLHGLSQSGRSHGASHLRAGQARCGPRAGRSRVVLLAEAIGGPVPSARPTPQEPADRGSPQKALKRHRDVARSRPRDSTPRAPAHAPWRRGSERRLRPRRALTWSLPTTPASIQSAARVSSPSSPSTAHHSERAQQRAGESQNCKPNIVCAGGA
jgi:hypothetical protein